MENMCAFYDTIKEYKSITAHDTNNTTKAIKLVLNETYNDSCNWVSKKTQKYSMSDKRWTLFQYPASPINAPGMQKMRNSIKLYVTLT